MKVNQSLHFKLLRTILLSLAIAICLSCALLLYFGGDLARRNAAENLHVISSIIADKTAFQLGLGEYYKQEAEETLEAASFHSDIDKACLYDVKGHLFAAYTRVHSRHFCVDSVEPVQTAGNAGQAAFETSSISFVPIYFSEERLGHLELFSSGQSLRKALIQLLAICLGALTGAALIAAMVGRTLVHTSLRPLDRLSAVSKRIAKNPFSTLRASKESEDEIGRLVDVFNSMLDVLSSENTKLMSSESRFRALSENSPIGVFQRSSDMEFMYANERWVDITGVSEASSGGFIQQIAIADRTTYLDMLDRAKKEQQAQSIEFRYQAGGGEERYLMEYLTPVPDSTQSAYVGTLVDVTELKQAHIELERLAFYDPLTSLPNRRFFRDHLELALMKASNNGQKLAVFMTDLDDFKKVNDTLGHDTGDRLLVNISARMKDAVFDESVVTRMGGDEFTVLVENIKDTGDLDLVCQRMLRAMNTDISNDNQSIVVSGSIGVAVFPDDGDSSDELMRKADLALYNSKAKKGNSFCFYSAELDRDIHDQIRIENKLRRALAESSLEVFIQPQIDALEQKICWGEALIRWRDKEDGMIPPDKFIPIAEKVGLIHDIGNFVLESVCEFIGKHSQTLEGMGMDGISINLSAKQFFSKTLVFDATKMLQKYNVPAHKIEFELTESMVLEDIEQTINVMSNLRRIGFRLSIDDFGTGYSSLSYLKRFPLTSLKIDRSFIKDIPDDKNDVEISCAVISLAHNLGLSVVAEGVETKSQVDLLAFNQCDIFQGYYFAKPMPMSEILELRDSLPGVLNKQSAG